MSFERFLSSDVYVFEHVGGGIECCGCRLEGPGGGVLWFFNASTPQKMIDHLRLHEAYGDDTGGAIPRITKAYEDLNAILKPYKRE